jgi:hypothetical protein
VILSLLVEFLELTGRSLDLAEIFVALSCREFAVFKKDVELCGDTCELCAQCGRVVDIERDGLLNLASSDQ